MNKSFPLDWKRTYWPEPRFGSKKRLVSDLGKAKLKENRASLAESKFRKLLAKLADAD